MTHPSPLRLLTLGGLAAAGAWAVSSAARRSAYSFRGRSVVITGGSRGLGLELAREFASEGARLALLARDADELRRACAELANTGATVFALPCDVCNRPQVRDAIDRAAARFGGIDVLVNNAGLMQVAPLQHMREEDFDAAMAVNFFGPLVATLAAIPHLRRAGGGRIVNVASIGGKIAVPHMLPYTASKFGLVGLSDGLRAELRREGIFVTTVCPGPMRTGSPGHALFKGRHRREYAWFAIMDSLPLLSVESRRAARRIVHACRMGRARLLLGAPTKLATLMNELFPGATACLAATANRLLPEPDTAAGDRAHLGRSSESSWTRSFLTRASRRAAVRNNQNVGASSPRSTRPRN